VLALFLTEAVLIGLAGATAGTAAGGLLSWHYSRAGLPLPELHSGEALLPIPPVLYFAPSPGILATGFALGVTIVAAAALYPAWRAARLEPVQALRGA
jgi:putative ABC transport system permease protein